MKCSDKEWRHCQKEKRGCEGCFYNDEISIGEYVRTDKGKIAQIKEIRLGKHKSLDEFINLYMFDNENWTADKYIVKHSKDIIDLIEVGDYVNGYLVKDVVENLQTGELHLEMPMDYTNQELGDCTIYNKDIKTIITKEQIRQIEYRIKE